MSEQIAADYEQLKENQSEDTVNKDTQQQDSIEKDPSPLDHETQQQKEDTSPEDETQHQSSADVFSSDGAAVFFAASRTSCSKSRGIRLKVEGLFDDDDEASLTRKKGLDRMSCNEGGSSLTFFSADASLTIL